MNSKLTKSRSGPASSPKFVFYRGHPYWLLWRGATKFGERSHLGFMDGSKTFWVASSEIKLPPELYRGFGVCLACGSGKTDTASRVAVKLAVEDYCDRSKKTRTWCREIVACDQRGGLSGRFLRGQIDLSEANNRGTCGVNKYFWLREGGVYEINEPIRKRRDDRYFCRVEDGEVVRIAVKEVAEWLEKHSE